MRTKSTSKHLFGASVCPEDPINWWFRMLTQVSYLRQAEAPKRRLEVLGVYRFGFDVFLYSSCLGNKTELLVNSEVHKDQRYHFLSNGPYKKGEK